MGCFLLVVALTSGDPGDVAEPVADTSPVGTVDARRDSESPARLIRVPLPITGNVERRIISQIRKAVESLKKVPETKASRPLLVLELGSRDPKVQGSIFGKYQYLTLRTIVKRMLSDARFLGCATCQNERSAPRF